MNRALERAGSAELREGQRVSYTLETDRNGKVSATDVQLPPQDGQTVPLGAALTQLEVEMSDTDEPKRPDPHSPPSREFLLPRREHSTRPPIETDERARQRAAQQAYKDAELKAARANRERLAGPGGRGSLSVSAAPARLTFGSWVGVKK